MKAYFTGQEIPPSKRVTTCQKCIRTGDIDNVGKTARHGTFFEMLGDFSFGDYFKNEIVPWSWEFVTKVLEIPEDRLYVTIYEEDDETGKIWHDVVGLPWDRIVKLGKEDNFWEHGTGPCGPCTEIYYDRGPEYGCDSPTCGVGCDCDRYMEFWNLVLTQFNAEEDGTYTELAMKNVAGDFGDHYMELPPPKLRYAVAPASKIDFGDVFREMGWCTEEYLRPEEYQND